MVKLIYWLCFKLVGRTDVLSQFRRYRATVLWLYKTLVVSDKRRFVLALVANVSGVTLQGGALSLLIFYASRMEAGTALAWGQLHLETREPQTFLAVIGILALLLLASAGLLFLGNRMMTVAALKCAGYASRQTLAAEGIRPPKDPDPSKQPFPDQVSGRVVSLIAIARAVRPLLQVSNPAVMFIYSVVVVVYINIWVTLLLILLVVPTFFLQYVVNYRAAENQEKFTVANRRANQGLKEILGRMAWAPRLDESQKRALELEYDKPQIRELSDRFAFRMMASSYSALISDVVTAIAAGIVTAYLGLQALSGELAWSLFLGYLIFARLLLQSLRGVLASITNFARFYPLVRKLYELLTSTYPDASFTSQTLRIVPRGSVRVGNRKAARIKRGEPVAMISPVPVSRFNAYAYVDALVGKRSQSNAALRASCFWVPNALDSPPGGSLGELLGRPDASERWEVQESLEGLGFGGWDPSAVMGGPLDQDQWARVPRRLRAHILLARSSFTSADLVLLEEEVLREADEDFVSRFWIDMNDRFLVVRYPNAGLAGYFGERLAMAMAADRSLSLMTVAWCQENAADVNSALRRRKRQAGGSPVDDSTED